MPNFNKYADKTLENDCCIDVDVGKLGRLNTQLAVNSMEIFERYLFPDNNERPLCMDCTQISMQATAILSPFSGNVLRQKFFVGN